MQPKGSSRHDDYDRGSGGYDDRGGGYDDRSSGGGGGYDRGSDRRYDDRSYDRDSSRDSGGYGGGYDDRGSGGGGRRYDDRSYDRHSSRDSGGYDDRRDRYDDRRDRYDDRRDRYDYDSRRGGGGGRGRRERSPVARRQRRDRGLVGPAKGDPMDEEQSEKLFIEAVEDLCKMEENDSNVRFPFNVSKINDRMQKLSDKKFHITNTPFKRFAPLVQKMEKGGQ